MTASMVTSPILICFIACSLLEHFPERRVTVSDKIMLRKEARVKWQFEERSSYSAACTHKGAASAFRVQSEIFWSIRALPPLTQVGHRSPSSALLPLSARLFAAKFIPAEIWKLTQEERPQ